MTTEQLRDLLQRYPGFAQPVFIQTELSAAQLPSCSVTQRSLECLEEDVLGRRQMEGKFVFYMRELATSETDRCRAAQTMRELGSWLESQSDAAEQLESGLPVFQETYDDGSSAWSMTIRIHWMDTPTE